jgi:hypothetical protein
MSWEDLSQYEFEEPTTRLSWADLSQNEFEEPTTRLSWADLSQYEIEEPTTRLSWADLSQNEFEEPTTRLSWEDLSQYEIKEPTTRLSWEDLSQYEIKEPTTRRSLAVPVNPGTFDPSWKQYYGEGWNTKVPMACGCITYACFIGEAETASKKYYMNGRKFDNLQQPKNDFLLTLFCGICAKQVCTPESAWAICAKHGCANWIAQNATKSFQ